MSERPTSILGNTLAVFEFELRRSLTLPRLLWWSVLALFPLAIALLIISIPNSREEVPIEFWFGFLFAMVPMLVSMLGTFLWTTSAVSSEIERQSWVYLAVRPHGRASVLLGKYLAAIVWVLPATLVGVTVTVLLVHRTCECMVDPSEAIRTWWTIARLACLAVPSYAAVYLALGTIFTKRAMVMAVAYTLIFELVVSWVPALVNKLTIQYRLRALFFYWADIDITQVGQLPPIDIFSAAPPWVHVTILCGWMIVLTFLSVKIVQTRDYVVSSTPDV